jgi:hypothetical protein
MPTEIVSLYNILSTIQDNIKFHYSQNNSHNGRKYLHFRNLTHHLSSNKHTDFKGSVAPD